ncbi:MAG: DNA topoisomerase VI subunit B, partial [Thermoplasmata archaeon]|nr:DNA topoisomerase VI subunit B [Thermoplasmata archaeon]
PDGTKVTYERAATDVPPLPKEVAPHPYGLELGELAYVLKGSSRKTLGDVLQRDLAGVTPRSATEVLAKAGLGSRAAPGSVHGESLERLLAALHEAKLLPPSAESLSPIGAVLIKRGLRNVLGEVRPDFYAPPVSRPPKIHGGFPFAVEVGLVYGGGLPADQPIQLLRFANRVPLLFQQGACGITSSVAALDWRRYGLEQKGGAGLPVGPVLLLVHLASTKIPFTSEAKEAIAEDAEIDREVTLALQTAARHLRTHMARTSRRAFATEKFAIIQKILPKLAAKASGLVGKPVPDLTPVITRIMDVVHVESRITLAPDAVLLTTEVTNYTPRARVLELFLEMPAELFRTAGYPIAPEGTDAELGRAWWTLPKLAPSERGRIEVRFPGGTDVDATDLPWFVAGVDEGHLLGAEPLPGDWEIRLPRAVIEAAEAGLEELPATTEGEVDYDAAEANTGIRDED